LSFFCWKSALAAPEAPETAAPPTTPPKWLTKNVRSERNRAPEWPTTLDFENSSALTESGRYVNARRGRALDFRATATDPEGDRIRYSAEGLPAGATFDEDTGRFRWTPAKNQLGDHSFRFIASDGTSASPLEIVVHVAENKPPVPGPADRLIGSRGQLCSRTFRETPWEVDAGNFGEWVLAEDPDRDALVYRAISLPPGATLEVRETKLWLFWQPEEGESGTYRVSVAVSDGELTTTIEREIFVHPAWAKEWKLALAPSFGYELYAPFEQTPVHHGFSSELTFLGKRTSSQEGRDCQRLQQTGCRPSHLRLYAGLEVLFPLEGEGDALFAYALGFTRSFEFNPARRFLIPHYGLEGGGMVSRSMPHLVQTTPYLGLHLFADRPVWLNLTAGMRIVPARIEEFFGPRVALSLLIDAI
jgi:hypothetical protein